MKEFYQDANNCPPFDVKFGGGIIKVSTDDTLLLESAVTISHQAIRMEVVNPQHQQVRCVIIFY